MGLGIFQSAASGAVRATLSGLSRSQLKLRALSAFRSSSRLPRSSCRSGTDALSAANSTAYTPRYPESFVVRPLDRHGQRRSATVASPTAGTSQWTNYIRKQGQAPALDERRITLPKSHSALVRYPNTEGEWSQDGSHFTVNVGPRMFPTMTSGQLTGYTAYQARLLDAKTNSTEKTKNRDIAWTGLDTEAGKRVALYGLWRGYQDYTNSLSQRSYGSSAMSLAQSAYSSGFDPNAPINPYDTDPHPELNPVTFNTKPTDLSAPTTEVAPRKTQTAEEEATTEAMKNHKIQEELARREMALPEFTAATLTAGKTYTTADVRSALMDAVTTLNSTIATGTTRDLNDLRMGTASINPYSESQADFDAARKKVVLGLKKATVAISATAVDSDESDEAFRSAHSKAAERTREAATILEERIRWVSDGPRRPNDTVETITLRDTEIADSEYKDTATRGRGTKKDSSVRTGTMLGDDSDTYKRWREHYASKLAKASGKTGAPTSGASSSSSHAPPSTSAPSSGAASTGRGTADTGSDAETGAGNSNVQTTESAARATSADNASDYSVDSTDPFADFDSSNVTEQTLNPSAANVTESTVPPSTSSASAPPTESAPPTTESSRPTWKPKKSARFAE